MAFQYQQIIRSRNNRVVIAILACLLVFFYLISTVTYTEQPSTNEVVYSYPQEILNRIFRLETKVDNMTSIFSDLTKNSGGKAVMRNFLTTNIDSFWDDYDENNGTEGYDYLYESNATVNHTTKLVTAHSCGEPIKLLILITTHVSHFHEREVIRNTWGIDPKSNSARWKTYFLLGRTKNTATLKKLKYESRMFQDIVLGDIYEDFYNLTYKVQMVFEWSLRYCQYDYMLKGDDDVFVNMPKVFDYIQSTDTPRTELYAGNVQYQAIVLRTGKYGIDKQEFKKKIYPRYCSGGGFLLSRDIVHRMLPLFNRVKAIKIDDAYIGELALKAGIDVTHNDNFKMFEDEKKCDYVANTIVHHPVKNEDCMVKLYKESLKIR